MNLTICQCADIAPQYEGGVKSEVKVPREARKKQSQWKSVWEDFWKNGEMKFCCDRERESKVREGWKRPAVRKLQLEARKNWWPIRQPKPNKTNSHRTVPLFVKTLSTSQMEVALVGTWYRSGITSRYLCTPALFVFLNLSATVNAFHFAQVPWYNKYLPKGKLY